MKAWQLLKKKRMHTKDTVSKFVKVSSVSQELNFDDNSFRFLFYAWDGPVRWEKWAYTAVRIEALNPVSGEMYRVTPI